MSLENNKKYLKYMGSKWGGVFLDPSLIYKNDLVISAGLAADYSLDIQLICEFGCKVVGIDPTKQAYEEYLKLLNAHRFSKQDFILVRKALFDTDNKSVTLGGKAKTIFNKTGEAAITLSMKTLFNTYPHPSLIKLDIEGAEYAVLGSLDTLPKTVTQLSVGFHHWLNGITDKYPNDIGRWLYTEEDTKNCIDVFREWGYKFVYYTNDDPRRGVQEGLFIRRDLATQYAEITV